jgi:transcriptional regulator with XRE-family HTH domain
MGHDAFMARLTYDAVLAGNIRATRGRKKLDQADIVERMRYLGFTTWHRQTMGKVERGERRVTAEEIFGLALALETTIQALMTANGQDDDVYLPSGQPIGAVSVERLVGRLAVNDRSVQWADDNSASFIGFRRLPGVDPFDREWLSQPHFTEKPDKWHPGPEASDGE